MIELTTKKTNQNIVVPIDPRVKNFISEVTTLAHPVFNRNIKVDMQTKTAQIVKQHF